MLAVYCYRPTIAGKWKIDPWYKVLFLFLYRNEGTRLLASRAAFIFFVWMPPSYGYCSRHNGADLRCEILTKRRIILKIAQGTLSNPEIFLDKIDQAPLKWEMSVLSLVLSPLKMFSERMIRVMTGFHGLTISHSRSRINS